MRVPCRAGSARRDLRRGIGPRLRVCWLRLRRNAPSAGVPPMPAPRPERVAILPLDPAQP